MIRYLNILLSLAGEPLAIEETKLRQVVAFLLAKAQGDAGDGSWGMGDLEAQELARVSQRAEQQVAKSDGTIGIIPVYGLMSQRVNMMSDFSGGTSTEQLGAAFRTMLADTTTKAIILDFDSPGGTVNGTTELAQEIFDSRGVKPVIGQINSLCASAAYWLACQCDEIVVTPSGQAGSIGVYTAHEDVSKMLEDKGINTTLISAGKYKTEGNPYGPLSDEAKAAVQARVDTSYNAFVDAVARGRGSLRGGGNITTKVVGDRFGQGRMFGADELVDRGMADRVGTMADTLDRFGITTNPVAKAARDARGAQNAAAATLLTKLKAGVQPTRRELEHGLKGLAATAGETLSNSEAGVAVDILLKPQPHGGHAAPVTETLTAEDIAAMATSLAGLRRSLQT